MLSIHILIPRSKRVLLILPTLSFFSPPSFLLFHLISDSTLILASIKVLWNVCNATLDSLYIYETYVIFLVIIFFFLSINSRYVKLCQLDITGQDTIEGGLGMCVERFKINKVNPKL